MYRVSKDDIVVWLKKNQWLVENGFMPKYHAVFADPPYALEFMSSEWDGFDSPHAFQAWVTEWARLMLSYVYPGALLVMAGGTRTYHRLTAGLEDAGWEIEDAIMCWTYGSGFPKSLNIGKSIDAKAGAERKVVGVGKSGKTRNVLNAALHPETFGGDFNITVPATPEGAKWNGHGTALKPSVEPYVIARAPRAGYTYAELALTFGSGALNIDGGRIGTEQTTTTIKDFSQAHGNQFGKPGITYPSIGAKLNPPGRFPANTLFACECADEHAPDCPVRVMDEQSGVSVSRQGRPRVGKNGNGWGITATGTEYDDAGGASRFFYQAKASKWEREAGLEEFTPTTVNDGRDTPIDNPFQRGETLRKNIHPTVKPIRLCEYIARLILPPELSTPRRILIPFSGSGSEMIGAFLAGWDEIDGVEQSQEYIDIANARLNWWTRFKSYEDAEATKVANKQEKEKHIQLSLFAENDHD